MTTPQPSVARSHTRTVRIQQSAIRILSTAVSRLVSPSTHGILFHSPIASLPSVTSTNPTPAAEADDRFKRIASQVRARRQQLTAQHALQPHSQGPHHHCKHQCDLDTVSHSTAGSLSRSSPRHIHHKYTSALTRRLVSRHNYKDGVKAVARFTSLPTGVPRPPVCWYRINIVLQQNSIHATPGLPCIRPFM